MAIAVQLDEIMADRRVSLNELSEKVGVTNVNLSRIKTGKVRSMRFSTLEKICESLECQPGDILKYVEPVSYTHLIARREPYSRESQKDEPSAPILHRRARCLASVWHRVWHPR